MRLIALLALGAGAAYAYKRFAEEKGGQEATAQAEPFSSDQLDDVPAAPEQPAQTAPEPSKDTLEQPTWLDPADADAD
jgi:hypothetical protein